MKLLRQWFRRNRAFFKLAVTTNLEYRLNYIVDAIGQPVITSLIEIALWTAIFRTSGKTEIGGFGETHYIAYVIWAAFTSRIASNWMYEFRMIDEVNTGSVNSVLVRPTSFFEYYMSQFIGYKVVTTAISLSVPLLVCWIYNLPIQVNRLPGMLLVTFLYLFFLYTLSFIFAMFSFFLNRIYGLTMIKNISLAIVSGEFMPLDLFPPAIKHILIALPFANGAFVPVGYLTGRVDLGGLLNGIQSIVIGTLILAVIARGMWRLGIREYTGTGA